VNLDPATMLTHHPLHDDRTQSMPSMVGCEKWLLHRSARFFIHAHACITDGENDTFCLEHCREFNDPVA
jgi:hypothetical protein